MCAILVSHNGQPEIPTVSDRYLDILKRIPRHRKVSATELFRQMQDAGMDVTRRSFQRYMEDICSNYDIEEDRSSRPHGYRWKPNAVGLSLPRLNAQEALLLLLANLGFFAWTQGWLDSVVSARARGDREPERLARELR